MSELCNKITLLQFLKVQSDGEVDWIIKLFLTYFHTFI